MLCEIQKVFEMFADKNNRIPRESIAKSLRCAGYVIDEEFLDCDSVDLEGFRALAEKAEACGFTREAIEACFRAFDPEETGYINAGDLKSILMSGDDALSASDVQSILDRFIPNDRGMVCYNLLLESLYEDLE